MGALCNHVAVPYFCGMDAAGRGCTTLGTYQRKVIRAVQNCGTTTYPPRMLSPAMSLLVFVAEPMRSSAGTVASP